VTRSAGEERRRGMRIHGRAVADQFGGRRDAVAATALTVLRRALVEGAPVSRERLASEASVNLDCPRAEAMAQLDAVAQALGVSSLS
jgi:hypothetical protein